MEQVDLMGDTEPPPAKFEINENIKPEDNSDDKKEGDKTEVIDEDKEDQPSKEITGEELTKKQLTEDRDSKKEETEEVPGEEKKSSLEQLDEQVEGEHAKKDDDKTNGEQVEGEHPVEEQIKGEQTAGEQVAGEQAADDQVAVEQADAEQADGEHVASEHEEGEHAEGEQLEGEDKGEHTKSEQAEGEHVEGEATEGEIIEGEPKAGEEETKEQPQGEKEEIIEEEKEDEYYEPPPDPAAPYDLSDSKEALRPAYQMRPDQEAELESLWELYQDYNPAYTDLDNYITPKELVYMLKSLNLMTHTPEQLQELIDYCVKPVHSKGHITYEQFMHMVKIRLRDISAEDELRSALQVMDPESTGLIDKEFMKDVLATKGNKMTPKALDNLIKEVDISQDGTIGVEDVVGTMAIDLNTEDIEMLRAAIYPPEKEVDVDDEYE